MRSPKKILVTGGAGFIGSNFLHYLLCSTDFDGIVVNVDKLTYAGNRENLIDLKAKHDQKRYFFERADICDSESIADIFAAYEIDAVVHFAAESHVDRSILGPGNFVHANVVGTYVLLEAARKAWADGHGCVFHHVSTDEVYGSLGPNGRFTETSAYNPRSPYSASKASSDFLVRAYHHTYGLPVTLSNCSNNFGPYQFPEKLIPLMILNMLKSEKLPVYGDGKNVRDWIYVIDHNAAVWLIVTQGVLGETYNVGGDSEWENIKLVEYLCEKVAQARGLPTDTYEPLVTFVKDRPGHDRRYALDCEKIKADLGWSADVGFARGIERTIQWYLDNSEWVRNVETGAYQKWLKENYQGREELDV